MNTMTLSKKKKGAVPMDLELENMLRPPELDMPPYPAKLVTLASGKKMIVRQIERREVPTILKAVKPTLKIDRDFYDVVGARLYSELIAWQKFRCRNAYALIAQVDNILMGCVNGRMLSQDVGISLHTLAIDRGLRVGAHLFAAKMEYHIEFLKQKEVWITAESPIGFKRWMVEYELEKQDGVQHELGGAESFRLSEELYYKHKPRLVTGLRPCPEDLLEKAKQQIIIADEATINKQICGDKGAWSK
jgi:hypothetical protein